MVLVFCVCCFLKTIRCAFAGGERERLLRWWPVQKVGDERSTLFLLTGEDQQQVFCLVQHRLNKEIDDMARITDKEFNAALPVMQKLLWAGQ